MAQVKLIYKDADGYDAEHSEATDSVKMSSFSTANYTLDDTALGHLVGGGDASSVHNHDSLYFRKTEFITTSAGVADASKPVETGAAGKLDNSLLDLSAINSALSHSALTNLSADDHTQYILVAGTRAFSGNQSMGGFKLTNLADPVAGTDAVNLQTLQAHEQGLKPKEAARVATTANINLSSPGGTIDGITLSVGDRVLVKNQTFPATNGIYIFQGASSAMTRSVDMDAATEVNGALVGVQEGTANGGKTFVEQGTVTVLGTDAMNFVFFNSADSITASTGLTRVVNDIQLASSSAGAGLSFTSGVLDVNVDGSSLEINSDTLRVKALGIKDSMIDFGTGANQVSGVDIPIADAGNYFATDNVEAALQQLANSVQDQGVTYLADTAGVSKGDPVYISDYDKVSKYSSLLSAAYVEGIALANAASGASVKVLANDTVLSGVLTGAVAGASVYWDGSAYSYSIPTGAGKHVWRLGHAKNATDLHVCIELIKKNS